MRFASFDTPGERRARRTSENLQLRALAEKLKAAYSSSILYRGMLYWTRRHGKKDGLAHFAFVDLFGARERWKDRGEPLYLDDDDFYEWMRLRELRGKRAWQRLRQKRKRANGVGGEGSGELREVDGAVREA